MDETRSFAQLVGTLQDVATEFAVLTLGELRTPSASLRERVMEKIRSRSPGCLAHWDRSRLAKPVVVTDPDGYVQWISEAFTEMCGYTIDELRGKKPGSVLQGPATDEDAVNTMSQAVHAREPVTVELINYHKNGDPYRVRIQIEPLYDADENTVAFVAQEEKLETLAA